MKKRLLCALLCALLLLSLSPAAFAEQGREENGYFYFTDRNGNEMMAPVTAFAARVIEFLPGDPWTSYAEQQKVENILGVADRTGDGSTSVGDLNLGAGGVIVLGFDVAIYDGDGLDIYVFEVGGDVEDTLVEVSSDLVTWYEIGVAKGRTAGVDMNGKVPENARFTYVRLTDLSAKSRLELDPDPDRVVRTSYGWPGADVDAVCGLSTKAVSSLWAEPEIEKAEEYGLIPECLERADLSRPITRAEFAAVAVKVFEKLTGAGARAVARNPFEDTEDPEVLKAYEIGAVNGTSATTFDPEKLLTREQCAAMLTRVYKRVSIEGWTLQEDASYPLAYEMPALFADDADISGYARDSVYFMVSRGILQGVGNNRFAPRNTTSAEEAIGYANATREQALAIAVRMVDRLG